MAAEGEQVPTEGEQLAPAAEKMYDDSNELHKIMKEEEGFLMRQKMQKLEVLFPACEQRNKYKVAGIPDKLKDTVSAEDHEDKAFKKALKQKTLFTLKEESDFWCRICGPWLKARREFTIKVNSTKKSYEGAKKTERIAEFVRPFKCHQQFGCFICQPMEITAMDTKDDTMMGRVVYDYRIVDECLCKRNWSINDENDVTQYRLQQSQCHNNNCCAPSICCGVHELEIFKAGTNENAMSKSGGIAAMRNYFPGCNLRACLGEADNFRFDYPENCDYKMKMTFMAAAILVDMMAFEKVQEDDVGGIID